LENNGDTMSQSRILINISKAFWNKIPDGIRYELLEMALDIPGLSPRELAVRFTDTKGYFVSESSVYRWAFISPYRGRTLFGFMSPVWPHIMLAPFMDAGLMSPARPRSGTPCKPC